VRTHAGGAGEAVRFVRLQKSEGEGEGMMHKVIDTILGVAELALVIALCLLSFLFCAAGAR